MHCSHTIHLLSLSGASLCEAHSTMPRTHHARLNVAVISISIESSLPMPPISARLLSPITGQHCTTPSRAAHSNQFYARRYDTLDTATQLCSAPTPCASRASKPLRVLDEVSDDDTSEEGIRAGRSHSPLASMQSRLGCALEAVR